MNAREIVDRLRRVYPPIKTSLNYRNSFELLVATILSAQCTDKRVNMVTKTLFKKYRGPTAFATAKLSELERDIKPTGYYHSKARHIKQASKMIVERYISRVPESMEELLQLPGVGRKTANIVLSVAYGKDEGIAVDTHVKRLARRLGLTRSDNPNIIERDLMGLTPKDLWSKLTILLILHGRNVCHARAPSCDKCILNDICPSAFSFER